MNQILYTGDLNELKTTSTRRKGINRASLWIALFMVSSLIIIFLNTQMFNSEVMGGADISQDEVILGSLKPIEDETPKNNVQNSVNEQTNSVSSEQEDKNNTISNTTAKTQKVKLSNGKTYETIAVLKIPSLNIEYPVLSKTSTQLLKISLNKYWGANPNEVGNMCIVGHNYKNTKFFSKLPKIKNGAIVKITDMTGRTLDYTVYHTEVIDPYDNACTSQLTNGNTEITLITCYNNGTQRFIAKARANK